MTDTEAGTPPRLLARWPEADLFAALDAEGWFRGMDTKDATEATAKVYARLARSRPATDPAGLDGLARAVDRYVVAVTRHGSGHEAIETVDARYAELLAARLAVADGPGPEERRYVDPSTLPESFYRRNPDYQGEAVVESRPLPDNREEPSR